MKLLVLSPLFSAIAWIITLCSLLVLWFEDGKPKSKVSSPSITFISGIGTFYDWIFITGSVITALFFVITLLQFLFYKPRHYLLENSTFKQRFWAHLCALFLGTASMASLIALTILNNPQDESIHWILTLAFSFLVLLCASFNLIAIAGGRHGGTPFYVSFALKILFIVLSTAILVTMISLIYSCPTIPNQALTPSCDKTRSISAILEWILGILFFVFVLSWTIDLW